MALVSKSSLGIRSFWLRQTFNVSSSRKAKGRMGGFPHAGTRLMCVNRCGKDVAHVPGSGSCPVFRGELRRLWDRSGVRNTPR